MGGNAVYSLMVYHHVAMAQGLLSVADAPEYLARIVEQGIRLLFRRQNVS